VETRWAKRSAPARHRRKRKPPTLHLGKRKRREPFTTAGAGANIFYCACPEKSRKFSGEENFMYEFMELEDLAVNATQLAQMFNVFEAALFDAKSVQVKCMDAMMLYGVLLKNFAGALQDYFDRAYQDWKRQEGGKA